MKIIDQTIFAGDPRVGNCLQAAIASLLNKELEEVPHFLLNDEPNWYRKMLDWLDLNGYGLVEVKDWVFESGIPLIAVGKSPRGVYHSVIYQEGKLVHDPHPSKAGIEKPEWYYIIFPKIDKTPKPNI